MTLLPAHLRDDFPILNQTINGHPLVYLDSAASMQKPRIVLEAVQDFYTHDYANIHRGVHTLSMRATQRYEDVRDTVARFVNASRREEIVFTQGATAAINLVAQTWGRANLREGDEIVLTTLEHHANIVPWQMLRTLTGCVLRIVPVEIDGTVRLDNIRQAITPRTKLLAIAHISNVLGTVLPVTEGAKLAHAVGAKVLVDGCQAVCHTPVDVQALGADFYVFSGHKLYAPSGVGVLWGRYDLLKDMPPWQGGGDMIESVTFDKTTFRAPPERFEAGTPPIAQVIGLGAAIAYVRAIGLDAIARHERTLLAQATEIIGRLDGIRLIGTAPDKAAVVSFVMESAHPHDIGTILDQEGVAIRTGHHCAQPLMEALGLPATARASFALYSTPHDVERLVQAITRVQEMFG